MIYREFNPAVLDRLLNDPSVRQWIELPGQTDPYNSTLALADGRNVFLALEDGRGGVLFEWHEPGVYQAHTQFVPEVRGRVALEATRAAISWMFLATDCMELLTKVPDHNRPALALTKRIGGTLDFRREKAWPTKDGGAIGVSFYALRYPEWVRSEPTLPAFGQWFHDRLEAEKERLGSPHEVHDDDAAHDRFVGATVAMVLAGQVAKAIVLYNRWARFAGYGPAAVVSLDPLVVDIQEVWLEVTGRDFRIIRCASPVREAA